MFLWRSPYDLGSCVGDCCFFLRTDVLLWFDVHVPIWKHLSNLSRIVLGTSVKPLSVFVNFTKRSPICWAGRHRVSKAVSRVTRHRPSPRVPERSELSLPCGVPPRFCDAFRVCHCQPEAILTRHKIRFPDGPVFPTYAGLQRCDLCLSNCLTDERLNIEGRESSRTRTQS